MPYQSVQSHKFHRKVSRELLGCVGKVSIRETYVAIHFGDEEDAIVGAHAAARVISDHLHRLRRLLFVVGHLERREWVTTVEGEGCKCVLLILEVYIGHAVDGEHGGDVLCLLVHGERCLQKNRPDRAELLEHLAHLLLGNCDRKA